MPKPKADSIILPDWRFTCTECGRCCRRWHVALTPRDLARLHALSWEGTDAAPPASGATVQLGGYTYLAHRHDGSCAFLDRDCNHCLIHRHFGFDAKPLGCRVYPLNIVRVAGERYSAIGRFDCPAICACDGEPLRRSLPAIRGYVAEMGLLRGAPASFPLAGLDADTAEHLSARIETELRERPQLPIPERLCAAAELVRRLARLGGTFLNGIDPDEVLPAVVARSREAAAALPVTPPNAFNQWAFLTLLTGHLRRDEEVMKGGGIGLRMKRTATLAAFMFGRGNPRGLGTEHPDWAMSRRQLFSTPVTAAKGTEWERYLDYLHLRLAAQQFYGSANYGLDFFAGLASLLLTYPLVAAAAKWSAMARTAGRECRIEESDLHYALAAIDHSFGRSAYLNLGLLRRLTRYISEPEIFSRLVSGLIR